MKVHLAGLVARVEDPLLCCRQAAHSPSLDDAVRKRRSGVFELRATETGLHGAAVRCETQRMDVDIGLPHELDAGRPPIGLHAVAPFVQDNSKLIIPLDGVHDVEITVLTSLAAYKGIDTPSTTNPHGNSRTIERIEQVGEMLGCHRSWHTVELIHGSDTTDVQPPACAERIDT